LFSSHRHDHGRLHSYVLPAITRSHQSGAFVQLTRRNAAAVLEQHGRIDEAIELCEKAGRQEDSTALGRAAGYLQKQGRTEEAIGLYRYAAESGDLLMLTFVTHILAGLGRVDELIPIHQRAAENGIVGAYDTAIKLFSDIGQLDVALAWLHERVAAGDRNAAVWLRHLQ
jgi:tetratricopeptide (TPR) repeat protein